MERIIPYNTLNVFIKTRIVYSFGTEKTLQYTRSLLLKPHLLSKIHIILRPSTPLKNRVLKLESPLKQLHLSPTD